MSATPAGQQRLALVVLLDGRPVGHVVQAATARLRFSYDEAWRSDDDGYPLSLSMPLTAAEHDHAATSAYLWGLLPDNERVLDRYARTFGVSARNPVALLAHIGADCAGAVQLTPPERLSEIVNPTTRERVEWIEEDEIARALRSAKETGLPGRDTRTIGRFSLAGAQPKIALFRRGDKWGRPLGHTPTTHILKPPSGDYPGFAENEHLSLDLASELDLGAARSEVKRFGDQIAIVVQRFDRQPTKHGYRRIHQEDVCQALSVQPWNKYESDGGPGVAEIVALIQESSLDPQADVDRFIDILALNWVLAAPDAHAKNYALLHVPGGGVRLAPFYDLASYLPYSDYRLHDVKLAMRVGREYSARRIARRDWMRLAENSRLRPDYVIGRIESLLPKIPDAVLEVAHRAAKDGLDRQHVDPLAGRIIERSQECLERLTTGRNGV
jgi:serine/threonine-protein kinase HipA